MDVILPVLCLLVASEDAIRTQIDSGARVIELPGGVTEVSSEIVVPDNSRNLEIRGSNSSVLRAAAGFKGRAVLSCSGCVGLRLEGFTIDGNRAAASRPRSIPPHDVPFSQWFTSNGVLLDRARDAFIENVRFREIAGFAMLATRSAGVRVTRIRVEDSGGLNERSRNNTSGGVLFEEGCTNFEVRDSIFARIRGNAVWTHSMYTSPRNAGGVIRGNRFEEIARDAIQVGHATRIRVEHNSGARIGFPINVVDVEGRGTPVAIDTAGNVDASSYTDNRFEEINGKCIDLDGFHHGEVRGNTCINRGAAADYAFGHYAIVMNNTNPDIQSESIVIAGNEIDGTKFGGIFIIGSGHRVVNNRLRNLNKAGCNESRELYGCAHFPGEPHLLESGIYLGQRAERPAPARGNLVENNEISGHKMRERCIRFAPGVVPQDNTVRSNQCSDPAYPVTPAPVPKSP
jgi:hypothetical protein